MSNEFNLDYKQIEQKAKGIRKKIITMNSQASPAEVPLGRTEHWRFRPWPVGRSGVA
jgi:hypothetical protein